MNKAFEGLIGKIVKFYVNDIIVKSKKKEYVLDDLKQISNRLRKIGMKLNPKKYTFGVLSGKCLGYLVSQRKIEANLAKIRTIQEMVKQKTIKDVKSLAGRMTSLGYFLARAGETRLLFYQILKHLAKFEWTVMLTKLSKSSRHISLLLHCYLLR